MGVQIGISPIAWQNDDLPDLTAGFTMEQALEESREIGYTGVERGQRMPKDTEGLRTYLEKYDIRLCGGWCSGHLLVNTPKEEIAKIRQQVEQFRALDAPCIVYAECSNTIQSDIGTSLNKRPTLSEDEIVAYAKQLSEVAKWSKDQGMPLAYHHHMGSIIENQKDIDTLMNAASPEVDFCFDTGHALFGGANVLETLERWQHRLRHIHFKDIRPDIIKRAHAEDKSFLDAVIEGAFTVPGDGCIDFHSVTRSLKKANYNGWIVVEAEQDPKNAPPYEYSKRGYKHIVEACNAAGLNIDHASV